MSAPRTQAARRIRIAEILAEIPVRSQGELREILAAEGFAVTQATLSRDLDDLGATKSLDDEGRPYYSLQMQVGVELIAEFGRLARAAHELVVSADCSGNMVVVRTPPGAAQYLASVIDRSGWEPVLGTVAGDDTVLLVVRSPIPAEQVVRELLTMAEGRTANSAKKEER